MASMNDWRAQSDLEILLEAERIKRDPKRLKAALKCAACRKEELAKDIGTIANLEAKSK